MSLYIDDNLEQRSDGNVVCRHCDTLLGTSAEPLQEARVQIEAPTVAGPAVRVDPAHFTDREVILRRSLCPGCLTMLQAEIVPADEPTFRTFAVGGPHE